jgi:hypothetical protein
MGLHAASLLAPRQAGMACLRGEMMHFELTSHPPQVRMQSQRVPLPAQGPRYRTQDPGRGAIKA